MDAPIPPWRGLFNGSDAHDTSHSMAVQDGFDRLGHGHRRHGFSRSTTGLHRGTSSAERCLQQRRAADVELLSANRALLQRQTAELRKAERGGRAAELPSALKRSHQAWLGFRQAQCSLEHLIDGTTQQYRAALVEACKLGLTQDHIQDIRRQTEL